MGGFGPACSRHIERTQAVRLTYELQCIVSLGRTYDSSLTSCSGAPRADEARVHALGDDGLVRERGSEREEGDATAGVRGVQGRVRLVVGGGVVDVDYRQRRGARLLGSKGGGGPHRLPHNTLTHNTNGKLENGFRVGFSFSSSSSASSASSAPRTKPRMSRTKVRHNPVRKASPSVIASTPVSTLYSDPM
ncbi:hypothetical protein FIBSPDRAFT_900419 [Athelia psychrophila]|uniref:Uncharacterized protein n=1 Tax=Athelia psychrophila TaxID=1759441 RepID=A0A165YHY9_9AGAM|nr:hypothetical protein FIBSPDRAFT_900419 [Fibularhizoctonia sp. CBS 109695]